MTDNSIANKIFNQWKANLAFKDKSYDYYIENFDELFFDFYKIAIPHDIAESFLKQAIAAHIPSKKVIHYVYQRNKHLPYIDSEKDFVDSWIEAISNAATKVFHEYYPVEIAEDKNNPRAKVKLPAALNQAEYRRQRKYADSFPLITKEMVRTERGEH